MKKMFLLFLGAIFCAQITQATTADYRAAASGDKQFSVYTQKKSAWCNVMRASQCANQAGFQKYLDKGCINDIDKESKCLKTFCGVNCASIQGCPQEGSTLQKMCYEHCKKVNLGISTAQTRLNTCVYGSLDAGVASGKEGSRAYYRTQQKAFSRMNKAGLKEAQGVLDLVNRLSQQRAKLLYVDSATSNGGRIIIPDFTKNATMAFNLTMQMKEAINSLDRSLDPSDQSSKILDQARALIAKSDKEVKLFVKAVKELSQNSEKLLDAMKEGSSGGSGARGDGYQSIGA